MLKRQERCIIRQCYLTFWHVTGHNNERRPPLWFVSNSTSGLHWWSSGYTSRLVYVCWRCFCVYRIVYPTCLISRKKQGKQWFMWIYGARGRTWTGTVFPPTDFKSVASTNFATRAYWREAAREFSPHFKLHLTCILKSREVYITKNLKGNDYLYYCRLIIN